MSAAEAYRAIVADWRDAMRSRLSSRQRVIVLTFASEQEALDFDAMPDSEVLRSVIVLPAPRSIEFDS